MRSGTRCIIRSRVRWTRTYPLLEAGEYGKARAAAYDVVLNGFEIGGGSIRIHEPALQAKMFDVLGVSGEQQKTLFGHILKAFLLRRAAARRASR